MGAWEGFASRRAAISFAPGLSFPAKFRAFSLVACLTLCWIIGCTVPSLADDASTCRNADGAELRIAACTRAIESGKVQGQGPFRIFTTPRPRDQRWRVEHWRILQICYSAFGRRRGATWTPATPARSIARCTNPEALASSTNSST